ncbi:MAG: hypothetical protein AB1782_09295 [Cyanobacteriota bacterium]
MIKKIIFIGLFIGLCVVAHVSQLKLDAYKEKQAKYYVEKNLLITLPTDKVKYFTLGFDNLIADIVWLQFIQYFGENHRLKRKRLKYDFEYIYKYVDVITTLDPNFSYAYWFGAFAIADEFNRPDLAMKIIAKGIKNNPKNWWLPYTAATMELMYNNNFTEAVKYIDLAAKVKPKSDRIKRFQDVLHSKSKIQEKTRKIWLEIYYDAKERGDEISMERAKTNLRKHAVIIDD